MTDCSWCGLVLPANMDGVVIDHIIPRARGGPNVGWNKQILHARCNGQKGDKMTPQAQALALARGVKVHEPNGRLRYQLRRQQTAQLISRAEKAKISGLPPGLMELQSVINDVLYKTEGQRRAARRATKRRAAGRQPWQG